jgi:hypothetical protein
VRRRLLIGLGLMAFLAVSLALARWLTTEGRERSAITELILAQGRGDAEGMLAALDPSCRRDADCRAQVEANARRLRRAGGAKIIRLDSATAYALGAASGPTRVAWTVVDEGLPVVQCVDVRRTGTALAGRAVTLMAISAPIGNEASC